MNRACLTCNVNLNTSLDLEERQEDIWGEVLQHVELSKGQHTSRVVSVRKRLYNRNLAIVPVAISHH